MRRCPRAIRRSRPHTHDVESPPLNLPSCGARLVSSRLWRCAASGDGRDAPPALRRRRGHRHVAVRARPPLPIDSQPSHTRGEDFCFWFIPPNRTEETYIILATDPHALACARIARCTPNCLPANSSRASQLVHACALHAHCAMTQHATSLFGVARTPNCLPALSSCITTACITTACIMNCASCALRLPSSLFGACSTCTACAYGLCNASCGAFLS